MATSEARLVPTSGNSALYGVAYDSLRDKIYWGSGSSKSRANRDGSSVEIVLISGARKPDQILDFSVP